MGSGLAERTLVLHVGIHKTASTYIQHRLKGNQPFLKRQGLLYPRLRRDHLALVQALRRGEPGPWLELVRQAAGLGLRPLISAEVLSVILHQPAADGTGRSLLGHLQDALGGEGVTLHLVAFVRDQPAYLNSRYTQLIKRLYFTSSFNRYVMDTLERGGESDCDYERLFGEALDDPRVRTSFLPFRRGEADPCERLLTAIGVEDCAALNPLDQQPNSQPGWQAVWLARRLAARLQQQHPAAWRDHGCKARLRDELEQLAAREGWPAEPFQGVNGYLLGRIERRFGAGNDRFARRVWGCAWRELFPRSEPRPSPAHPRDPQEQQHLEAEAERLLQRCLQA
jgi:hypothetical protein